MKRQRIWSSGSWVVLLGLIAVSSGCTSTATRRSPPVPAVPVAAIDPASVSPPSVGRETVNATLWMQQAAEYRIATEQVFRLAIERLATTIAAPGSAAVEQRGADAAALARLPTAVVVDLDETILDNSFYQARRALAGAEYDEPSWEAWMREGFCRR
jgi:acid phosphatase